MNNSQIQAINRGIALPATPSFLFGVTTAPASLWSSPLICRATKSVMAAFARRGTSDLGIGARRRWCRHAGCGKSYARAPAMTP
jgi:hypothetical protein